MMSDEEFTVKCYRTSLEDVGTPELDERILTAAHRRVVQRRVLRVGGGAIALVAMVLVVIHVTRAHAPSPEVTNYGAIEGVTRSYLLQVQAPAYAGPGMSEGR
jgi:hypothetical protein